MKKILTLLFIALLPACSPIAKYRSSPEVLSWENDIRKFEQADKTNDYPPNSILFAGSSSIRLWSTLEHDMAPYPVIQRGFGGSKLSDLAVYSPRIFDPHKCRAIVIFVANDITGSNTDKTPAEVAALFRYVLKSIRKNHPVTPVFWIAVTPTSSRWKVWPQIQEVNRLIRTVCEKNKNTYFITTEEHFMNSNGMPDDGLFIADKLHLNSKGYEIWTSVIKGELDKVLR
jgi:hypothetical protein